MVCERARFEWLGAVWRGSLARMRLPFRALTAATGLVLAAAAPASAAPLSPGTVRLIDRPSGDGALPADSNNYSIVGSTHALSADGRFGVFESDADALVAATIGSRTNRYVYVRDRQTNTIENVCRSTAGVAGDEGCASATISPNGRYVAFTSSSTNLGGPAPSSVGVFVHDRQTHTTTLMSRRTGLAGAVDTGFASHPAVADNGTVVFDTSGALDPVVDTGNSRNDIYSRTLAGVTTLLSQNAGTVGNGFSMQPDISGSGAVVVFMSMASNLSAADANTRWDIYTVPSNGGALSLKSRIGSAGAVGNGESTFPSLSQDGLEIAYTTTSTNLFAGADGNGKSDVVLRSEPAATNTPVSVVDGTASTLLADGGWGPRISANGDAVLFQTREGGVSAAALRTVGTNATKVVSRRAGASGAVVEGTPAGVSSNADVVMFGTGDLDPGQLEEQVWARVLSTHANDRLSRPGADDIAPQVGRTSLGDVSADGRFTVFVSTTVGLGGTSDGSPHAYLRDERSGTTAQLDLVGGIGGTPANVQVDTVRMSDDGSRIVFQAYGSGLAPGDESGPSHLYLWQRSTGQLSVVSRAPDGTPIALAPESGVDISGDGTKVAFVTEQNFLPGDANAADDVFVRDLTTGAVQLASIGTAGGALTIDASSPRLDGDGSVVAFVTSGSLDPVADTTNHPDAYLRDLAAARTELVSRKDGADTAAGDGNSYLDSISADGDRVVFTSFSKDLGDGVTTAAGDVHLRERSTNRTLWVSRSHDGSQNDGVSSSGSISADGRTIAFESSSKKLLGPVPTEGVALYTRALDTGTTARVVPPLTIQAMQSYGPALSANGQCVAFTAIQPDLVAGGYASPDFQHVYLKALGDQCVLDDPPATPTPTPTTTPRDTTAPVLSALSASRKTLARSGKRRSTTLSFAMSEPALVRLEIAALSTGKRKGKQCLKPSKVKGRAKACVREGAPKLVQTVQLAAGKRSIRFTGVVHGKRVRPGRYRLILTATDAAGNATAKRSTVDVRIR